MKQNALIPEDISYYLDRFNRVDYKAAFAEYKNSCGDALSAMEESDVPETAARLLSEIEARMKGLWKRRKLLDMQYFLMLYFSPCLLSENSAKAKMLAIAVRDSWKEKNPRNGYELTDMKTIAGGFLDTVLGFKINTGREKQ